VVDFLGGGVEMGKFFEKLRQKTPPKSNMDTPKKWARHF